MSVVLLAVTVVALVCFHLLQVLLKLASDNRLGLCT